MSADRRTLVLVATVLGSSVAFVDVSVVNVALPTIGRDLGLGLGGRQWVYLAYSLALASLYLPAGGVGDRLGRRRVFLAGAVGFACASALAGAAPAAALLFGARVLQGATAAFLSTASLALLRATYGGESGRAVGLWTAWTGVATIGGPPIGGALTEWVSWRLVFFINLPLIAGACLLALRGAEAEPRRRVPLARLDLPGGGLFALGFASLAYGLVERGHWWTIGVAAAALAGAVVRERKAEEPMLPLRLFRNRSFAAASLETLFVYAALGASTFFLVLYLQSVVGYSPLQASLPMVPVSVVMLFLAGRFGGLADRHGPRLFLATGPVLLAGGMALWAGCTTRDQWWLLGLGSLVFALGLSMTVAPITATTLDSAPERLAGIAAGVSNAVARVGGLVAVALVGLAISLAYTGAGSPLTGSEARGPTIHAFRVGIAVAAALALVGALVGAVLIPGRRRGADVE